MRRTRLFILIVISLLFPGCDKLNEPARGKDKPDSADPAIDVLPSWNETASKKSIIDFVTAVTTEGSSKFVPVEDRIATFDNDGTLWAEQPLYFEFIYSLSATKLLAKKVPTLIRTPEMKALVGGDNKGFRELGEKGILEAFTISHTAMGIEEFNTSATGWLDTAMHKRFGRKYKDLTYKPMVELLQYLRRNGFKTFIVSGGSAMFVRTFSEAAYGIPPEQVVGTMFRGDFVQKDGTYDVTLKPDIFHLNDNVGKPLAIYQFIGSKPILSFGNSDGDLEMLEWTSSNTLPNLSLILHHTDAEREYAYDKNSHIGKLDKALLKGQQEGWIIVDMKHDFKKIFSYE